MFGRGPVGGHRNGEQWRVGMGWDFVSFGRHLGFVQPAVRSREGRAQGSHVNAVHVSRLLLGASCEAAVLARCHMEDFRET